MPTPSRLRTLDGSVSLLIPAHLTEQALMYITDYIVYDVWIFFELLVVYFLFVETGNSSLEQTAALLDGVDVKNALAAGATKDVMELTTIRSADGKAFDN